MSVKQETSSVWSLLAAWIVASSIGWAAGLAVASLLLYRGVATILPWLDVDRFFSYAALISLGLTTGAAQSVVMRLYVPRPMRWLTATLVGYLLCIIVVVGGNQTGFSGAGLWDDVLTLSLMGAAIGTSQWWMLRQHFRRAWLWVLASAVGFLCFMWLPVNTSGSLGEFVIRVTVIGALGAAVTGAVLVWLLRHTVATVSQGTG